MKHKRLKWIALTLALLISVGLVAGCGQDGTDDPLKVGMELAYPPFETKDVEGEPMGISVELARAFGEHIGREVEIVNLAWDGLIPALETEQVDMVLSSMTITEKRAETVDFSDPYAWAYLALLVNTESGIETPEDFNKEGHVLAARKGTSAVDFTQANYPLVEIRQLASESAAVTEVAQGKADAFMYDQLSIYRNFLNFPDNTRVVYIPGQTPESWGAAFKKGNRDLVEQMNTFIRTYREDGGFDRLGDEFLSDEKEFFAENNLKFFFDEP